MFTDEQDIERALKAASNVNPSAGFEARVHAAVRRDLSPHASRLPSWLAAAATILLAVGWWVFSMRALSEPHRATQQAPVVAVPSAGPRPAPAPPLDHELPSSAASLSLPVNRSSATGLPASANAPVSAVQPDVIVPANQLEVLRRLAASGSAGPLSVVEAAATPAGPAELVVPPLVVEPIPVVALDPAGGGQGAKGLQ